MKKYLKYLLVFSLLLIPTTVFAESESPGLGDSITMHVFMSLHVALFGLWPIARLLNMPGVGGVFKLFLIRVVIIIILLGLGLYEIAIAFDIILTFGGGFILWPLTSRKKVTPTSTATIYNTIHKPVTQGIELHCNSCKGVVKVEDKFCEHCGKSLEGNNVTVTEAPKDTSPIVVADQKYLQNEDILLQNFIKAELAKDDTDPTTLCTTSLKVKRAILNIILFTTTFIAAIAFFFNIELKIVAIIEILILIIYFIINSNFNIMKIITKKVKTEPDRAIDNILLDYKQNNKKTLLPPIITFAITLVLAILIPSLIFASPKLIYTRYGEGYKVLRYTRSFKNEEELIIPKEYKGLPVLAIEEHAFYNSRISEIKIPNSIEVIKTEAFKNAINLKEIKIPSSVKEIRAAAFENCTNLEKVYLPEGLETIRANAFANNTSLRHIKLPSTLTYLGAGAFENCTRITEIEIPKGVTEINGATFKGCTLLEKVTLHDDITSIHGETFMGCESLIEIKLPSKITEIRGDTFNGCYNLQSIVIPEGVTRIGGSAFRYNYDLRYVSVPSTVTEIGSSAFRSCSSLTTIRIPANAVVNERTFKDSPTQVYRY